MTTDHALCQYDAEIIELDDGSLTPTEIGRLVGCHPQTVVGCRRRQQEAIEHEAEVAEYEAIEYGPRCPRCTSFTEPGNPLMPSGICRLCEWHEAGINPLAVAESGLAAEIGAVLAKAPKPMPYLDHLTGDHHG